MIPISIGTSAVGMRDFSIDRPVDVIVCLVAITVHWVAPYNLPFPWAITLLNWHFVFQCINHIPQCVLWITSKGNTYWWIVILFTLMLVLQQPFHAQMFMQIGTLLCNSRRWKSRSVDAGLVGITIVTILIIVVALLQVHLHGPKILIGT